MNINSTYFQFLHHSYQKILKACLQDQAIETFKLLQNKEYLLLRINQLFSEIYVGERERKIQDQIKIINSLKADNQSKKALGKYQKCSTCEKLKQQLQRLELENHSLHQKINKNQSQLQGYIPKKIQNSILKQNEEMKKQINKLHHQIISLKKITQHQINILQQQKQRQEQKNVSLSNQIMISSKQFKQKIKEKDIQINRIEEKLIQYLQNKIKYQNQQKQISLKYNNLTNCYQKLNNQLKIIKNQNIGLQQKYQRTVEETIFLNDKLQLFQKQNKKMKKILDKKQQQNSKLILKINDEQNLKKEQNNLKEKVIKSSYQQRKAKQYQRIVQDLKSQLNNKQKQFNSVQSNNEKLILQYSAEIKQLKNQKDKQKFNIKSQYKKQFDKIHEEYCQKYQAQKQQLINKYQAAILQKQKIINKKQLIIKECNKKLISSEQQFQSKLLQLTYKCDCLNKDLQEIREKNIKYKEHIEDLKVNQNQVERINKQKFDEVVDEKKEILRQLNTKQKQNKQHQKEILKYQEKINSLQLKIQSCMNQNSQINRQIDQYSKKNSLLSQKILQKQKQNRQLSKNKKEINQQKEQIQRKLAISLKSQKRYEEKVKKLQAQMLIKKQEFLKIYDSNKQEILDTFQKAQQTSNQSKRSIQSYYTNLIKNHDSKMMRRQLQLLQKQKQAQLQTLRAQNQEYSTKINKLKQRRQQQQNEKYIYLQKIMLQQQIIEKLKLENNKLIQDVSLQKQKNINLIRSYQQKMLQYHNNFEQFKRQFYLSLKQELQTIKNQYKMIIKDISFQQIRFKQINQQIIHRITKQIQSISNKNQTKIQKIKNQYEYGIILKIQEQKQQLLIQNQIKLKQQKMQFYTIIAEHEYQKNSLKQLSDKSSKQINIIQHKNIQLQKINRQLIKKDQQLKQIIKIMDKKINQNDKIVNKYHNQLEYYKNQNKQLKQYIKDAQINFKEKIQKCREKYSVQNQRLFAKYQKQFNKLIVSNRKGLEMSSMVSNSCSNLHMPTKGGKYEGKLQKLQKQIEEQKKKLNNLEHGIQSKQKLSKTTKLTVERQKMKPQNMRKI